MASINKAILIGNLGADPEIRYLSSGDTVANIRIATTERYKDRTTGESREITEWHRIVLFGRFAEIVSEYLKKGSSVYIEGRIRTRKWQSQDGIDRYSTEIIADHMQMLGNRVNTQSVSDNIIDNNKELINKENKSKKINIHSQLIDPHASSSKVNIFPNDMDEFNNKDDVPF